MYIRLVIVCTIKLSTHVEERVSILLTQNVITKVFSAFEDNKITSRILDRVTETLESVGGYRPHRNHQNPFLPPESAFPPFSPSRVSRSSDTIPFSPSPPSFSPLELLDGGSGDAGNVSFVRGPVSAGSSNHLFPSSLGYI